MLFFLGCSKSGREIRAGKFKNDSIGKIEQKKRKSNSNNSKNNSIDKQGNIDFLVPKESKNKIILHTYFTLSYNSTHKQPDWVAYKVFYNKLRNISRTDDFREDPKISGEVSQLSDYEGSNFDRGHLAPARLMSYNNRSMSESFYLTNISPQSPSFNRGIWKRLEEKVAYWASKSDSLYVVTGPLLDKPLGYIGANRVSVPRAFFKAILRFDSGKIRGMGFFIPHQNTPISLYSYSLSIDELETITDLDFFYNLDDKLESEIEKNRNLKLFLTSE